jgi:hypothetical protein
MKKAMLQGTGPGPLLWLIVAALAVGIHWPLAALWVVPVAEAAWGAVDVRETSYGISVIHGVLLFVLLTAVILVAAHRIIAGEWPWEAK